MFGFHLTVKGVLRRFVRVQGVKQAGTSGISTLFLYTHNVFIHASSITSDHTSILLVLLNSRGGRDVVLVDRVLLLFPF